MRELCEAVWPLFEANPRTAAPLQGLRARLGDRYGRMCYIILRHVFLIELVKLPQIETTKFQVAVGANSSTKINAIAGFDECLSMGAELLTGLGAWLDTQKH